LLRANVPDADVDSDYFRLSSAVLDKIDLRNAGSVRDSAVLSKSAQDPARDIAPPPRQDVVSGR
jgi:hypothetical protein